MTIHIATPLIESRALSQRLQKSVWLKMEALQPSGSFKARGIGHACSVYQQRGAQRFISSSGGNAGLAVAYAGRKLGVPVLVVVPETTPERAKKLIALENAEVIVHGQSWMEANAHALSLVTASDAFLHPFDDPLLWTGHATMMDEVAASGIKPDVVLLSVGGGGLLCGVVEGLQRNGWQDVPVLTAETAGADSYAQSLHAGELVELPAITSIATSLGARKVAAQALAWAGRHPISSAVVSDAAAIQACLAFLDAQRIVVEPACGATLAALDSDAEVLKQARNIVVVVCGGVVASSAQLQAWNDSFTQ